MLMVRLGKVKTMARVYLGNTEFTPITVESPKLSDKDFVKNTQGEYELKESYVTVGGDQGIYGQKTFHADAVGGAPIGIFAREETYGYSGALKLDAPVSQIDSPTTHSYAYVFYGVDEPNSVQQVGFQHITKNTDSDARTVVGTAYLAYNHLTGTSSFHVPNVGYSTTNNVAINNASIQQMSYRQFFAHQAMPTPLERQVIPTGAAGTIYRMPFDGYVNVTATTANITSALNIYGQSGLYKFYIPGAYDKSPVSATIMVAQGQDFGVGWTSLTNVVITAFSVQGNV